MNKLQRKKDLQIKKESQETLKQQVSMIGNIPDFCTICNSPFDKKSKEHAQTWNIAVWNEERVIKLFCPQCQISPVEENKYETN